MPGHPAYGQDREAVDVEAHGGLTYAARCAGPICHVPAPDESDDVWWLGFDCGHAYDVSPALIRVFDRVAKRRSKYAQALPETQYRDVAYVKLAVEFLAHQLAAMKQLDAPTSEQLLRGDWFLK